MIAQQEFANTLELATEQLQHQPPVVILEDIVHAIGDIHGDAGTVGKAVKLHDEHSPKQTVFLGDFVDRGEKQIEAIYELATLVIAEPETFILVRGNHEDFNICRPYGFLDVVAKHYDSQILPIISNFFSSLPIAAVQKKHAFFCHGGIPKTGHPIRYSKLEKDGNPVTNPVVLETLFNDPVEAFNPSYLDPLNTNGFFTNPRGPDVFCFDYNAAKQFVETNGLKYIIRAHVALAEGYTQYNSIVHSVFSSAAGPYRHCKPMAVKSQTKREPKPIPL